MGDEITAPRRFSWGQWFGGSCLAAIASLIATILAFSGWSLTKIDNAPVLIAVAVLPGVIIAALAYRKRNGSGFLEGVITGACVVALLSGACFSLVATS